MPPKWAAGVRTSAVVWSIPMNWLPVFRLNMASSGRPHFGHASPISMPFCDGMSVSAFTSSSLNGFQNSFSTPSKVCLPATTPLCVAVSLPRTTLPLDFRAL